MSTNNPNNPNKNRNTASPQFENGATTPQMEDWDPNQMELKQYGQNNGNGILDQEATSARSVGDEGHKLLKQQIDQEENDVEGGKKDVRHGLDVLSLAIGNANDAVVNNTYGSINFSSEETKEWLSKIQLGEDKDLEALKESGALRFSDTETKFAAGSGKVEVRLEDGSRATLTQAQLDLAATNGYFTIKGGEGHSVTVQQKKTEVVTFTAIDTSGVSFVKKDEKGNESTGVAYIQKDKQGQSFITIEGTNFRQNNCMALQSLQSVSVWAQKAKTASDRSKACQLQAQAAMQSGNTALAQKYQSQAQNFSSMAEKYTHASEAWKKKSAVTAQFTTSEDIEKRYDPSKTKVLDKNGNVTSYSARDLIGMDLGQLQKQSASNAARGSTVVAAGQSGLSGVITRKSDKLNAKADAVRKMADAGYDYLLQNPELKNCGLKKTHDPVLRLRDLNRAQIKLQRDLAMARHSGDLARVKALEGTLKDIESFKKHGGNVRSYQTSQGLSASQKRGVRFVADQTGITSSDVMSPVMRTASTVGMVKSTIRSAASAGRDIQRSVRQANSRYAQKQLKKYEAKRNKKPNHFIQQKYETWEKKAQKAQEKEAAIHRLDQRDRAKRRGGIALKNYKEEQALLKIDQKLGEKRVSEIIQKRQNKLIDQKSMLEKKIEAGRDRSGKLAKRKAKIDRREQTADKLRKAVEHKEGKHDAKLQSKKDKIEKKRMRRADREKNRLSYKMREKWNNSKVGAALNKAGDKVSGFFAAAGEALKEILDLKKYLVAAYFIIIFFVMASTSVIGLGMEYASNFFGDLLMFDPIGEAKTLASGVLADVKEATGDMKLELQGNLDKFYAKTRDVNYNQYVIDRTAYSMGSAFAKVCASDAKWHFLIDKLFTKAPSGSACFAVDMDWYMALDKADVGHIWAREEADNTTKHKKTGELVWKDTYISNPAARTELDGVNVNLAPILSMANYRCIDGITFRNFRNVQAYCYYMFIATHDKARYDDRNGDGDVKDEDESPYELDLEHPIYCGIGKLHIGQHKWNTTTMTLTKAKPQENNCTNVYYHGFSREAFGLIGGVKLKAATFVDALTIILKGKKTSDFMTPIGTELSSTPGLDIFSGNWRELDPLVYSVQHMKVLDRTKEGAEVEYYENESAFIDKNGDLACHNFTTAQWSNDEKMYVEDQRNEFGGILSPYVKKQGGKGNVWGATTCGYDTHDHSGGRIEGVCNTGACPYKDHIHDETCPKDEKGNYICDAATHIHDQNCCDLGHEHLPWNSYGDPGCWTTIVICQGHCGGHIKATMNVVVMNTWESLMACDNFKMCYFLREKCFTTFLDWDHYLFDLDVWMFFWNQKIHSWFNPLAQGLILLTSPFDFLDWAKGKITTGIANIGCYGSKEYKEATTDEDTPVDDEEGNDAQQAKLAKLLENKGKDPNLPKAGDPDYEKYTSEQDLYDFAGWWSEGYEIVKVYTDPKSHYSFKVTKKVPEGYDSAVELMESLYGTNENNWETVRLMWHAEPVKTYDKDGNLIRSLELNDWGVNFPSGNDAKDPGKFYKLPKKDKK